MKLQKNNVEYELTDETQIKAFLNAGWQTVQENIAQPARHDYLKTTRERKANQE